MRDYTYIDGTRFGVSNLFRSLRFDVDRLDPSWVDSEKPKFIRGMRIVDNDESQTLTVDGEDGDNLLFSLTLLYCKNDNFESFRSAMDGYLKIVFETKEYLVTNQKKNIDGVDIDEVLLH